MAKIIYNFVTHFIDLFKNNGKIIFIMKICSNWNTEARRNNESIFLFNCLPLSLYQYTCYIMFQKMKSLCFKTEQGNFIFLAAN